MWLGRGQKYRFFGPPVPIIKRHNRQTFQYKILHAHDILLTDQY